MPHILVERCQYFRRICCFHQDS